MKPIRGPIDYGGYPARRRRQAREAQAREAQSAQTLTPQQEAEREAEQIEHERAARLKSRAEMFRRAAHDAHGFATHGHIALVHDSEDDAANANANANEKTAANTTAANAAAPNAIAPNAAGPNAAVTSRSERVVEERRARLQRQSEIRALRRDRSSDGWKRVRRLTWAMTGILTILCVGLALTRPEMRVSRVGVQGARLVPIRVLEKTQSQLLGQNIFRARTREVVRTLQLLPVVKEARVRRLATWPPQMAISVVERQPFVRVGNDDSWWMADENGVPFRLARMGGVKDDSKFDAIYNAGWTPTIGKPLPKEAWARATQFAQLLSRQRAAGKTWNLKRIYFDEHGFVSVRLAGGFHDTTLVQLGGEDWAQKLNRARQSLDYLQSGGRRASVLNLITYAMPVWTPRVPVAPLKTSGAKPSPDALRNG